MATEVNSYSGGAALYFAGTHAKVRIYEGTWGDTITNGYKTLTKSYYHTLAALHGWEIKAGWQFEEEYAQDSTLREGVARHHFKVDLTAAYARMNPTVSSWLASRIMDPESQTMTGVVADTSKVYLFQFAGIATAFNGIAAAPGLRVTVDEVYFEGFNLPFQENKFVHVPLTGHGRILKYENQTAFAEA